MTLGFIKKGVRSAGVQRQYTGTSGRIDNCQLGVFLAYGSSRGRALVDREPYLPTSWTEDADRCAAAGVPAEVGFATKPQLGIDMLARAHTAGVLSGWVTADEAFGQNRTFRSWPAAHAVPFVLVTRSNDTLTCPDGRRHRAENLLALAGDRAWERRSAGPGAHGDRLHDWTVLALHPTANTDGLPPGWGHCCWSAARSTRNRAPTPELAFYRCAGVAATPVPELIRVATARWAIEECFQTAKNEAGLDHHQVRGYRAWYAHVTLAMLAAAYLAATCAQEAKKGGPAAGHDGLIPLSSNEIRRLLTTLVLAPITCVTSTINWSNWRRHRQHQARLSHHRRRGHRPP